MNTVVVIEYERIYFSEKLNPQYIDGSGWYVPRRLLERLRHFDERHARAEGTPVFDWTARDYVKATSQVGVIQVPGLVVEILPKIDRPDAAASADHILAQNNLLYMLSVTSQVPILERDLAHMSRQRMPLLEALISIFVERLLKELLRGIDHAYIHREENLPRLKGKLLINQNIRHNAAHQEKMYVAYDEFVPDTCLNQIIKATCRKLLGRTSNPKTQKQLREAVSHLDEVTDMVIGLHDFGRVHLNRNTERFRLLLDFCRMVITGESSSVSTGKQQSFSLLFPMEVLFEEFIASVISKNAQFFNLGRHQIHVQAKGKQKCLLKKKSGSGVFRLKPDILIENSPNESLLIVDTKWKHLKTSAEDTKNGVNQSDIYQLYAYAHRYLCVDNVLLYPRVKGVESNEFSIATEDDALPKRFIRIEQIGLNKNLLNTVERSCFLEDLKNVLKISNQLEESC